MKRIVLGTLAVFAAASLNAAVVATVNGQNVTDEDVALLLRQVPGAQYDTLPADIKQQVINQAIDRKLLIENAIKSGIEKDSEYTSTLAKVKNEIALEVWMGKEFNKTKVSDSAVKKFYDENADKFLQPEKVKASHILVKTEDEAKAIIKELSGVKGKDLADKFTASAKKNSTEPGADKNGGDLGWFAQNQMVKPFSDVAFKLAKGEVSKTPVKTDFGYHVIFVEDKQAAKKSELSEVKGQIEEFLKRQEFQKNVEAQAKTLRDKAKIDIKK